MNWNIVFLNLIITVAAGIIVYWWRHWLAIRREAIRQDLAVKGEAVKRESERKASDLSKLKNDIDSIYNLVTSYEKIEGYRDLYDSLKKKQQGPHSLDKKLKSGVVA